MFIIMEVNINVILKSFFCFFPSFSFYNSFKVFCFLIKLSIIFSFVFTFFRSKRIFCSTVKTFCHSFSLNHLCIFCTNDSSLFHWGRNFPRSLLLC